MILHVFNPEHDIALACDRSRFTPPEAARRLRARLEWLPAVFASDGDMILAGSPRQALENSRRLPCRLPDVTFATPDMVRAASGNISAVRVWGWDRAIRRELSSYGISADLLPGDSRLSVIRRMSHRQWAATHLLSEMLPGLGVVCTGSMAELGGRLAAMDGGVAKAPWSSSGRGVRYIPPSPCRADTGWCRNIIERQGSIMLEPRLDKIVDFGMEFSADGTGGISYRGLSIFRARNGAYTGNLLASEEEKRQLLSRFIAPACLDTARKDIGRIMSANTRGLYSGPFGVDMMVFRHPSTGIPALQPCVELNLRTTMGHVALALQKLTGHADGVTAVIDFRQEDYIIHAAQNAFYS